MLKVRDGATVLVIALRLRKTVGRIWGIYLEVVDFVTKFKCQVKNFLNSKNGGYLEGNVIWVIG